jgi:outer membrane protein assembly factor BamA
MDTGQLGMGIDDSSFSDLRVSVGFGVRIIVPYFTFPIALDLGFPVMSEETDDRKVFYFTLGKF